MRDITTRCDGVPRLARVVCMSALTIVGMMCAVQGYAEELRDPFTFGPRRDVVKQTGLILLGVLWDATHPLAIIGDETVGVGDSIAGWQVVEIQQNGVGVQRGERKEFIALGQSLPSD